MRRPGIMFIAASLIVALTSGAHAALAQQPAALPSGLAIEVLNPSNPPSYLQVPGGAWYARFRRIENWQPPSDSLPVLAVDVAVRAEEGGARITVAVHLGKKYHDDKAAVATYLAREGEKIVAQELTKFGVAPFEFTLVRVKPPRENPPAVVNHTESIEVLGVERKEGTFPSYVIRLRNNSSKGVGALSVHFATEQSERASFMPRKERDEVLIEPGAVHEISVRGRNGGRKTEDGYTPDNVTEVKILTALFADGSYEGEAEQAAGMRALKKGREVQIARLVALLHGALNAPDLNAPAGIERFRRQVSALGEVADARLLDKLRAEFSTLGESKTERLRGSLEFSLHNVKAELLDDLKQFESERSFDANAFRKWLGEKREVYEGWLGRLR